MPIPYILEGYGPKEETMNPATWATAFQLGATEARDQLHVILQELDSLLQDLHGDPESESARHFRSLLTAQSEGLIEHLKILSTIFYISSFFSSHSSLREVLSLIVDSVKQVLNFRRVIILLLNEQRTALRCEITSGLTYEQSMKALSGPFLMDKHDCVETKVAHFGTQYLIATPSDPRLTDLDRRIINDFNRGCTIYVPINTKKGIIGVFGVDRKPSLPLLQLSDVERVQLFANYIGVLIENAKLYESIIQHKNRFENIVQQTPNGIITADPSGRISLVNPSAELLLGIKKADFLQRPVEDLLGRDTVIKVRNVLSEQDRAQFYDLNFTNADSKALVLNLFAQIIRNESGPELLIILQDITEKKNIDKRLQALDKLASIGTMAAGIAHEIRSPLTSISMDLDALYECASDKERVQATVVEVLNEIERMDSIVSNLLQFARPVGEAFSSVSVQSVIEESISLVKKKLGDKRITFHTHFNPSRLEILGNPGRLKQMMVNLLMNAVEAIERQGVINISTDLLDRDNELMSGMVYDISVSEAKGLLRISVEDNGVGIPTELRGKIFDPYFTTKKFGTGLGLAIVSKIAAEHSGYVSLVSGSGENTRIDVCLPAVAPAAKELDNYESYPHR